jgi:hypothetical protein
MQNMGESLLLLTIVTLVILTIRRGKPVVLDNPVIIERPGQYHITLAPQLNRAQTFIEQIAKQFSQMYSQQGELATQFFEVSDPKVFARGESFYLLAIAMRGGVLYSQAINPQPLLHDADSHLKNVREFSEAVLALHPLIGISDEQGVITLGNAVETAASQLQIGVKKLQIIE